MHSDIVTRQLVAAERKVRETCAIHVIAGVDAASH